MKRTFETFQPDMIRPLMALTSPACFNGMCRIRQYRVTVEEIMEGDDVLESRLRELWRDKKNGHSSNRDAMQKEADRLGIDLWAEQEDV